MIKKTTGPDGEVRVYLGGVEYVDGVAEAYNHGDGRVVLNDGTRFQFKIVDHLGNTVVLFEDKDGDDVINSTATDPAIAEVLQRNLYYPFGLGLEGEWVNETAPEMRYLFNGKELANDYGLNWSYYGFRMYDSSIGRFPSVDPIADQFPHVSPFNYAENEPIGNIDLHGLQKYSVKNGEIVGTFNEVTVTAKAPWWYNNYKGYIAQGQFSDAMAYRRYARIGGLGPTVSAQINNGEYPRLSGMKAWSPDAGGGTADWQNGIGGNLQKIAAVGIGVPLLAGVGASTGTFSLLTEGASASGLFSLEVSAASFVADGAAQYGMSLINGEPFRYNIISGLSNGLLKNPFAANYFGSQFTLNFDGNFEVNSFGSSLVAGSIGGVLGQYSAKLSGYLSDNFKINWVDSYGQASSITNPIATGTDILTQSIHNLITSGAGETTNQIDDNNP
ncbi:MAG: RHS repeat-associated core domain-containing protein [Bacteroidota bacterium]